MTGILFTKRYNYATVFVENFFRYSYMNLQYNASAEDTLEVKHSFESMADSHGIIIKKCHADNDIFRANAWVQDFQEHANPHLRTYSGVDYHHTNGLAERRIRDIQYNGRSMMIHAQ